MKRIEFIIWAGKQGWKHGQTYLNKAYSYLFSDNQAIFPNPNVKFYNKAKNYTSPRFIADQELQVKPTVKPENLNAANTTRFVESAKKGNFKGWTPRVIKGGKKADGGRIDKPLPTRSRDI